MKTLAQLNQYSTSSVIFTDETLGAGQVLANRYQINGLLDTAVPVMENIEKLCNAAGSWLSYDIHEGKWGIVVNQTGTSIASFNDSNIIGNISVSGTGLQDLYNSVKVEFPHRDLRDSADFVTIEIPAGDRNPNEFDNILNISYDVINEPVQADLLGFIELKQSRVDLVIKFNTDFSYINLKAGDIIDVTDSRFSFSSKLFRIVTITEVQEDSGPLMMEITALEYDADVYSTADLYRYTRSDENGIVTIGSIGVPGTPQISKFEVDARPRVLVESTAPTGVVEGMEFWLTNDVSEIQDQNRSYTLIATKRPVGGGTYNSGDNVVLDYDQLNTSNFYIKTRGFNATTVGPYSDPSGYVSFTATQVTDAIGPNTKTLDVLGNIGTLLGAYYLLKGVDELYQKVANTGSLFTKIFETLRDETGIDLIGPTPTPVGPPITIQDEGTVLTTTTTVINFTGGGVTASSPSTGTVVVNIEGGTQPGTGGSNYQFGFDNSGFRSLVRPTFPNNYNFPGGGFFGRDAIYTSGKMMFTTVEDDFGITQSTMKPIKVDPGNYRVYFSGLYDDPSNATRLYYSTATVNTSANLPSQTWGNWKKIALASSSTFDYNGGQADIDNFLACPSQYESDYVKNNIVTITVPENAIVAVGLSNNAIAISGDTVDFITRTIMEYDMTSTGTRIFSVITATSYTSLSGGFTSAGGCGSISVALQKIE